MRSPSSNPPPFTRAPMEVIVPLADISELHWLSEETEKNGPVVFQFRPSPTRFARVSAIICCSAVAVGAEPTDIALMRRSRTTATATRTRAGGRCPVAERGGLRHDRAPKRGKQHDPQDRDQQRDHLGFERPVLVHLAERFEVATRSPDRLDPLVNRGGGSGFDVQQPEVASDPP